jgi:hypothetical protein
MAMQAVLADNTFDWMNCCDNPAGCANGTVAPHGQINVVGECYGGNPRQPQPSFFNEVTGNLMRNSNGIDINDGKGPWTSGALATCPYQGPFVRWQIVRRNVIGGVALSSPGRCGTINATGTNATTDLVIERNVSSHALLPYASTVWRWKNPL